MAKDKKEKPVLNLDGEKYFIDDMTDSQKELASSYRRKSFVPTQDVSSESDELKALAASVWTDAVKAAYTELITEE